jgi:GR25 family glycosyltransferase involved in LPS biosynthesis
MSFEWFDAVDGHSLPIEEFVKEGIEMKCRGSCGCALSHKRLWKKIVDEDIDRAIVFEDDVIFHEKFRKLMPFFWKQTPRIMLWSFWGIVIIGAIWASATSWKEFLLLPTPIISPSPLPDGC